MADAMLLEDPTPLLDDTDNPEDHKHIVNQWENKMNITEAQVLGVEIVAICGYKWIPYRNPDPLPMCPSCKAIMEAMP